MRAGTIVASNYTAMAQVLGESFLEHHPDSTFVVLIVDDGPADLPAPIEVKRLADLDVDAASIAAMKTIYDVMEFSTAVKPSLLRLLLDGGDDDRNDNVACYLDPDICVYAPFDDAVAPAVEHGIVLTPHALEPIPRDGLRVDEGTIMQAGMYNCGFIAVGGSARPFLDWWDERLRFDAVVDFDNARFTDQRWVDWVPSLFDFSISRDRGMNIAWWNIHERHIADDLAQLDTGEPVRFVHFSAYDPANPDLLSKHQLPSPRVAHAPGTPMRRLADDYAEALKTLGHIERRKLAYQWDVSTDGVVLTPAVRRAVRSAILDELSGGASLEGRATPDGFGGGIGSLGAWLGDSTTSDEPESAAPVLTADVGSPPSAVGSPPSAVGDVQRVVAANVRRVRRAIDRGADAARRQRRGTGRTKGAPLAFLHVPKSAGSSIVSSLRTELSDHTWGDWTFDRTQFGPYRNTPTPPDLAARTLPNDAALAEVDAVAGHYSLPTLLSRFEPADVALALREPRSRLLSLYEFWRGLSDAARADHLPWTSSQTAVDLDFGAWLAEPSVAYQTDNIVIRQLIGDDPAIPANGFIANSDLARLARQAEKRMRALGWVGLVEQGDTTWTSLGAFVGAELQQTEINVTERQSSLPTDLGPIFKASASQLAARTAGDDIVYRAVARRIGISNVAVTADEAWMRRLGVAVVASS